VPEKPLIIRDRTRTEAQGWKKENWSANNALFSDGHDAVRANEEHLLLKRTGILGNNGIFRKNRWGRQTAFLLGTKDEEIDGRMTQSPNQRQEEIPEDKTRNE